MRTTKDADGAVPAGTDGLTLCLEGTLAHMTKGQRRVPMLTELRRVGLDAPAPARHGYSSQRWNTANVAEFATCRYGNTYLSWRASTDYGLDSYWRTVAHPYYSNGVNKEAGHTSGANQGYHFTTGAGMTVAGITVSVSDEYVTDVSDNFSGPAMASSVATAPTARSSPTASRATTIRSRGDQDPPDHARHGPGRGGRGARPDRHDAEI